MTTSVVPDVGSLSDKREDLIYKDPKHVAAQNNVRKFFRLFLFIDFYIAAAYLRKAWLTSGREHAIPTIAFVLDSLVALCFTFDVIVGSKLLWRVRQVSIKWEDLHTLTALNWYSNVCSLVFLSLQRLTNVTGASELVVFLVYLLFRVTKLKPLRRLKQAVDHAHSHPDDNDDVKLRVLVDKFAVVEESWLQTCMRKALRVAVVIVIATLFVAVLFDATHVGTTGALNRPASTVTHTTHASDESALALSGEVSPTSLSAMGCGANSGGVFGIVGSGVGLAAIETADGAAVGGVVGGCAGLVIGVGMAIASADQYCT